MVDTREFRELIWEKGKELYRDMPWRDEPSFYHVLVSEIMLQQTQVSRVLIKFAEFMTAFPTIEYLAAASLADVLRAWQGLGYNRRAKYLHQAAKQIVITGQPQTLDGLMKLPGIGRNTAAAIMNYVYEVPTAYVETNIRTVFFHHFFAEQQDVSDKDIFSIVSSMMDREHPREFFWALMDYGAALKAQGQGKLTISKHYKKQPPLAGSVREIRGQMIRALSASDLTISELRHRTTTDERFQKALDGLLHDKLVEKSGVMIHLTT